jgi:hypothetical protein
VRAAVLSILVIALAAAFAGPPDPAGLLSVAEVVADRLLAGDPAGAARALAALDSP